MLETLYLAVLLTNDVDQPSRVFVNGIGGEKACVQHIKNKLNDQRQGHSVVYTDDHVEFHIENEGHIRCSVFSDVDVTEDLALELDELRALRDLDKKAKQNLEQQLVSLKEDIAKVTEHLLGAQNDREELAKELARLTLENQQLRQSQGRVDKQVAQRDEEIQAKSNEIALLNASITALENRIAQISGKLREAQDRDEENQVTIANLGKDLNQALAQRVNNLGQYRSNFFGRVRQAVKSVPGIDIRGDRFVFGSELLFPSASAELNENGRHELASLSEVIMATVDSLPDDVDWVLRIDGHTDIRPIRSPLFGSNRELSMARAMSVLRALARAGIPSERLLATGFGSTRPVAIGNSEESLARNRRIEIKLTTP